MNEPGAGRTIDAYFGVGCLHFGVSGAAASYDRANHIESLKNLDLTERVRAIREALEEIPSIEDILLPEDVSHSVALGPNLPFVPASAPLTEGLGCFPHIDPLPLDFTLYLPDRIQQSLTRWWPGPVSERWRVSFRSTSLLLPIVFVRPLDEDVDVMPSHGIAIVREFLKKQSSILAKHGVALEALGPSPFHVECAVIATDESELEEGQLFSCHYEPEKRGYGTMLFMFDKSRLPTVSQALEAIWDGVKDEFAVFYLAQQVSHLREEKADETRDEVSNLVLSQTEGGLKGVYGRTFSGRALNGAFLSAAISEDVNLSTQRFLEAQYERIYSGSQGTCLSQIVEKAFEEAKQDPISHFHQLITLFEARRSKNLEVFAVVISALLGGIAGAIITGALTP